MITLQVTYQIPEDQDAFQRAHFAAEAWAAIDDALYIIRLSTKHDARTAEDTVEALRVRLLEAKGRME
jgi:hypothetical protein